MDDSKDLEFWGIVELFGRTKIAGYVSTSVIGGQSFVRVDVPAVEGSQGVTKLYGPGAIYCMTPVSEEAVKMYVDYYKPAPIIIYQPVIKKLPGYDADDDGDKPEKDNPYEY